MSLIAYCQQPIDDPTRKVCLLPPGGKVVPDRCSVYESNTDGGVECRQWVTNRTNKGEIDEFIRGYCSPSSPWYKDPECACVNRASDPQYKDLYTELSYLFAVGIPDRCWYVPCKNEYNLRPSAIIDETCPKEICQNIIKLESEKGVNVKKIKQYLSCGEGGGGGGEIPTIFGIDWRYAMAGIAVFLILLAIGVSLIVVYSRPRARA